MPTWNASQYLQFNDERTRPCRELAARINLPAPKNVIDLGCGPGNSTGVLTERWPSTEISGLDSSSDMIAEARRQKPAGHWQTSDISGWAEAGTAEYDLVFSNAALQWVDDHATLFPKLLQRVKPGGALAIQMPGNWDAPAHQLMREVAASPAWRSDFAGEPIREWHVHDLPFYYDALSRHAALMDCWATEYQHVLPDTAAIVEWYKGTGLRPFLDRLTNEQRRNEFCEAYRKMLAKDYPSRADGRVLFPFRRLFVIAYR